MNRKDTASTRPQVVFFGSGPVAAESLELLSQWCEIEAVITKPRPEHHHEAFPVLTVAKAHSFRTITAANRRELNEAIRKQTFTSCVAVLIDFGIIVSPEVIDTFELGIINSHFSLLPEWRGADPITFAILSGQAETGVSLMLLVEAMDEGPILAQAPYQLPPDYTTPQLTADLITLSNESLKSILPLYLEGHALPMPQEQALVPRHEVTSYSRKLTKADGVLDFTKSAEQLEREIRAFIEWPKSRTQLAGKDVIITKAHATALDRPGKKAGDTEAAPQTGLIIIQTARGQLCIERLKPAGKNEMSVAAFLAGNAL